MQTKELVFPSGVGRRMSFRQDVGRRDRYTAPWSCNVRLEDFTGRLRGGSWTPAAPATLIGIIHSSGYVTATASDDLPGPHPADCLYRDRYVRPVGHVIYASRQGDYTDWDTSPDISDVSRPFAIQLSEAGEIGTDITALVPHKDSHLLASTCTSLWVVTEDPTVNGTLRNISRDVGMVGARAWCRDHLDRYYFLSSHGIYTVGADGSGLQALSEDVIPEQLTGVTNDTTVLEYDHETRGVSIHIPGADVSWFFDTERQGFWPFKAGYTGSHVAIGPIQLGDGASFGRLLQLHGILAQGSVDVTWRVLIADTAEQVSANAKAAIESLINGVPPANIHSSGVWAGNGANHRSYPRARGQFMVLLLSAASGDWGWEGARAVIQPSGAWR